MAFIYTKAAWNDRLLKYANGSCTGGSDDNHVDDDYDDYFDVNACCDDDNDDDYDDNNNVGVRNGDGWMDR